MANALRKKYGRKYHDLKRTPAPEEMRIPHSAKYRNKKPRPWHVILDGWFGARDFTWKRYESEDQAIAYLERQKVAWPRFSKRLRIEYKEIK